MKNLLAFIFTTLITSGAWAQTSMVTFNVNMSNETVAETGVYIGGGVIGGHNAHQLTDDDGDGTYSVTIELDNSASGGNYIFLNGNCPDWSCKEQLGGQPCADPSNWNDRILPELTGDTELNFCFGICSEDGSCELAIETADITFSVNTQTIEVGANGMYLGGGDYFGDAMGHAMSDADGDGTYEVVVAVPVGYSGNYVFLNSPNDGGDWNAKEDLAGLPCADGTWNDRLLPTVTGEASYSTCFGQCSTDGSCEAPDPTSDVTFSVDMSDYSGSYGTVNLNGSFNGWCGGCNPMADDDGDLIYEVTLPLNQEDTVEYKFTLDGWTNQENFSEGDACTSTIDGFTNRTLTVATENMQLSTVCWNSCDACPEEEEEEEAVTAFIGDCELFDDGPNNNWPYVYTATTPEEPNSNEAQTMELNVVSLPEGGANFRVVKSTANGNWFNGPAEPLSIGMNTKTVAGVNFPRAVKFQFSSGDVEFDSFAINGELLEDCFEGEAEPSTYNVTFNCNTETIEVGPNGMYLGGGDFFGDAMGHAMADDDGDGIYTVTVAVPAGYSGNYIFLNSPNDGGDWGAKEDLAGQECADGTWNDRLLPAVTEDTTLSTCYGQCSTDGTCEAPSASVNVTLRVDMNDYPQSFGFVNLSGSLNGWCGDCNQMSDDDGDGVYEITVSLEGEATYEYKFTLDNWAVQENFNEGDACTTTINGFTNRSLALGSDDVSLDAVCFNSCDACTGAAPISVTFQVDMSVEGANPAGVFIAGSFQGWDAGASQMTDDDGDLIYTYTQTGILPNTNIQWKYLNGASFDFEETVPATCNTGTNRFHDVGEEDEVLDVVCFSSCVACDVEVPQHDVTFNVNTANIEVGPNGIYLGGGVFGDAMAHAMSDDDGDGVWTVTVSVDEGLSGHYIFLNSPSNGGDWGAKENLEGLPCGDPNNFNDRFLPEVTEALTLSTCFGECSEDGSCSAPPEVFHDVTFNCNTATITVGPNGMYLGGGDYFGDAMGHAMSDDDGDGIYTVTVAVPDGYSGNYVYLNSPNDGGDWGAKEDLAGQECADGTWNDRLLPTVTEATTLSSCFGQCSTDGSCEMPAPSVNVTFKVDMSNYADGFGSVNLNGGFTGWCGSCVAMTDDDGDNIYEVTIELEGDATYEYKFTLDGWTVQEMFEEGDACTSTIDGFTNRTLTLGSEDVVLAEVCFNSCDACEDPAILGCTDPFYVEFDMEATEDDGSCSTPVVFGCIYEAAENFNDAANTDDGSCEFDLNACPGDLDGDGLVATPDLLQFLSVFGTVCD